MFGSACIATSCWATLAATVGDSDGGRMITSIIALLSALGVALLVLARWVHRRTRPDPALLAPLEVMGDRSWRRADAVWQRRRLDEVRPEGAEPLVRSVAPPSVDEAFERGPAAEGFDDLRIDPLLPPTRPPGRT
ncbi:MAG: hypothetical protein ACO307_08830 [Ilumatobacteraceae bacterium]